MTDIRLVRHGQTDWNLTGRWQGQAPDAPGLNDMGRVQALALLNQLKDINFSAIYSSDLLRARQTAELIAGPMGLTVTLETRLREINLGVWEGMLSSEVETQYPQELAERARDPYHARAPQGESPSDMTERVVAAVNDIAKEHADESVIIVSHGVSLAIIICHAQGFPLDEVYEHVPENAKLYRVEWK
ncbi:MAG: histidine phosphatase family protein [Chloroflexi bacterium]|nr:histidine phosphatase family protein [Chloroflexota bacterium]